MHFCNGPSGGDLRGFVPGEFHVSSGKFVSILSPPNLCSPSALRLHQLPHVVELNYWLQLVEKPPHNSYWFNMVQMTFQLINQPLLSTPVKDTCLGWTHPRHVSLENFKAILKVHFLGISVRKKACTGNCHGKRVRCLAVFFILSPPLKRTPVTCHNAFPEVRVDLPTV